MPDLDALRAAWPPSGSLEAKLALINSMQVPGPTQDIALSAIREKLQARMEHLQCFALMAKTRDLRRRLHMEPVSQAVTSAVYLLQLLGSNEGVIGKYRLLTLKSLLGDLVADEASGISAADADDILALSASNISWAARHGFSGSGVTVFDAIEAGLS
jgi:hypothetical protein